MNSNTKFLNAAIEFLSTKWFEEPLFQWKQKIFKQSYESVLKKKSFEYGWSSAINKIEADLLQEKIDFINNTHQKELQYQKNVALESKKKLKRSKWQI